MSGRNVAYRLVRRAVAEPPPLDEVQRAVVAHTGGPLLVLGGPGTGKTTTLEAAVAARVAEGTDPERLLVLTFGRRAAGALRQRVERRVAGVRPVREPLVRTFHSYAFGLLRRAAIARGEPPPRLLTGPEQDVVIRELLAGERGRADDDQPAEGAGDGAGGAELVGRYGWPQRLWPALATREFARQLRDLLLRAAERGIDAAALARLGAAHGRPDWRAAARFRVEYEAVLALRDASSGTGPGYDYAELVRAAVRLLRDDPDLLAAQRRRLAAVYVDEFADTDPAQRELLELIAGQGATLVVFADPDSAIFGFRGGDPDGVRTFPDRFPTLAGSPAPTLTLTRCYRAGDGLLPAAARVRRRLRGPAGHRRLTAAAGFDGALEVRTFPTTASEHAWLAGRLREAHLRQGVPWSRMAVLVRAGRQLTGVQRALRTAEVPAVVHAEDAPLAAQPAVAPLLRLLRCVLAPDRLDEEAAVGLLHSPLGGADPFSERRLRQGLRARAVVAGDPRPSGELLVEAVRDPAVLAGVEQQWAAPARRVAGLLQVAREAAAAPGTTPEAVLWAVWQASGLAQEWSEDAVRQEAADRDLDAVVALFDTAAQFSHRLPGAGLAAFLDHLQSQELPGDSLAPVAERGEAVRLLTVHAAKGLEWDVVAVPGVQEGVWPDLRLRGSLLGADLLVDLHAGRELDQVGRVAALLDEERRLFHVAVTRARRQLLVSAVAAASVGEHEPEEPSRFLRELAGGGPGGPDPGEGPDSPVADAGPDGPDPGGGDPPRPDPPPDEGDRPEPPVDGADPPAPRPPGDDLPEGAPPELAPSGREPLRPLTLAALVAELRAVVTDPAAPPGRRRTAARHLARLATAGVRGAHPDQWWGLAPLSDDRPLAGPGEPVRVSPSAMESALRCGLRWLLERHGGAAPPSSAQQVGDLVHATATLADQAGADRTALVSWLAERFDAIEHAAAWLAGPERQRAEQMVEKLLRWVAENPRRLVAVEREFSVRVGQVVLRGRVDRLEVDDDGRLVVVDLKTGRSAPANAEIAEHPQLGAYQAAVAAGAFAEYGTEPGGAALVHLGTSGQQARVQEQPPLAEVEDPAWAPALVRRAGEVMAAATFTAVRNHRCRICPVRPACPISGQGRQVVEP